MKSTDKAIVAGLILAGGQATRMGGIDKGLQCLLGKPLIQHVIDVVAPQVDLLTISANRHLTEYQQFGYPVITDLPDQLKLGPLGGLLSFAHQLPPAIDYVAMFPCDTPYLPTDLISRLEAGLSNQPESLAAYVQTENEIHPSLLLARPQALVTLPAFLDAGHRKIRHWLAECQAIPVMFPTETAFVNINDLAALAALTG